MTRRMGLAISLVAMEKEKVRWLFEMQRWINYRSRRAQSECFICVGVVPRLPQPGPRLLQHPAEGRGRLHHLVQRERGELRSAHPTSILVLFKKGKPASPHTLLPPFTCSSCLTLRSIWSAPSPSVNLTLKCPSMSLMERSRMVSAGRWEVCVWCCPPHTQHRQQNICC